MQSAIELSRNQAIEACVAEALPRIGGALMKVIDRCQVLIAAMRRAQVSDEAMQERSEHLPERLCGSRLAEDLLLDELSLDLIVERHRGEFDAEQLHHDVKVSVRKYLRNSV